MNRIRIFAAAIFWVGVAATPASAQTFDHLQIWLYGVELRNDGGEQRRVSWGGRPGLTIGAPVPGSIWKDGNQCVLGVAVTRRSPDAEIGWTFETTPIRVIDDAVTFKLVWRRDRDRGRDSTGPGGSTELTLRPGEAIGIDAADLLPPGASSLCPYPRIGLRVAVDYFPPADMDRRVVATDLWLVRRSADGSQHGEQLSVRGQPNRPAPFYFSTVTDAGVWLDFYGELTVKPRDGYDEILLVTRSRLIEGGRASQTMPMPVTVVGSDGRPLQLSGARKVTSTVQLRPDEVVAVQLPRLTENNSGAFANETFSITLRSRQIR
jgi:hypothetical protein